ncbi:MAG TPA: amidohydrolase family protein [Spirochaetia bacterium]|nr:amidohydrolase family protein [Spirochaetia bacterium]
MASAEHTAKAILEDKGIIKDLFDEIPPRIDAERVDVGGCHVYPGFIDTHTHSFEAGIYSFGADLNEAKDLEGVFSRLAEARPLGGKVFAYRFDENALREKRFPTVEELDRVLPSIPLFLRRVDGHSGMVNTAAYKKIPWSTPPRPGVLKGRANSEASFWFHTSLSEEAILKVYHAAAAQAVAGGHTVVHTMIGNGRTDPMHYRLIRDHLAEFSVEFILYPQITDVKTCIELGSPRIGGCICADGSFGSHTAFLSEPYTDMPETRGEPYHTQDFWDALVREAWTAGLQVAVHAIGDGAIEQIVTAYEKNASLSKGRSLSEIIHNELLTPALLKRESRLGIAAVMQPMFDRLWGGESQMYARVLGKERALSCNRLASLVRNGVLVTGGSDWYITEIDAGKGIDAATRLHNSAEALSPFEAVMLYTKNAAQLSGDEDRFGCLLPGFEANFSCLSEDILSPGKSVTAQVVSVYRKGNKL